MTTHVWTTTTKTIAAGLLVAWAGIAYAIGASGLMAVPVDGFFRPIALTAAVPIALFLTAYASFPKFRQFVLAQDLRALTMLQHWRVLGFAFLMLYAHDILPGLFAFPAGVGDVLVGLAAPFMVARLASDPTFAESRQFATYHALGLLDFIVAVSAAGLASGAFPNLVADPITSGPMEVWPLNLFPSFVVPILAIAHLAVFLGSRPCAALKEPKKLRLKEPKHRSSGHKVKDAQINHR